MILAITDTKTLADLQDRFSECFPYLKIEFYYHPHHWKEPSLQQERIDPARRVGDITTKHEHGFLEIKSWYQTGRVEQDLHRLFGLNAQIFRQQDGVWVQTAESDKLTLEQQNDITTDAAKQTNKE